MTKNDSNFESINTKLRFRIENSPQTICEGFHDENMEILQRFIKKYCDCKIEILFPDDRDISNEANALNEVIYFFLEEESLKAGKEKEILAAFEGCRHISFLIKTGQQAIIDDFNSCLRGRKNTSILLYENIEDIFFYIIIDSLILCDYPLYADLANPIGKRNILIEDRRLFRIGNADCFLDPENILLFSNTPIWNCLKLEVNLIYDEMWRMNPDAPREKHPLFTSLRDMTIQLEEQLILLFYSARRKLIISSEMNKRQDYIPDLLHGNWSHIWEFEKSFSLEEYKILNVIRDIIGHYINHKIDELQRIGSFHLAIVHRNQYLREQESFFKQLSPKIIETIKVTRQNTEFIYHYYSAFFSDWDEEEKENIQWLLEHKSLSNSILEAKARMLYDRKLTSKLLRNNSEKEQENQIRDNLIQAEDILEKYVSENSFYTGEFLSAEEIEILNLLLKNYNRLTIADSCITDKQSLLKSIDLEHKKESVLKRIRQGSPVQVIDNNLTQVYYHLGWLYRFLGEPKESINYYEKAKYSLKNESITFGGIININLENLYASKNMEEEAKQCEQAMEFYSDFCQELSQPDDYRLIIGRAPDLDNSYNAYDVDELIYYGRVAFHKGYYGIAIDILEKALSLSKGAGFKEMRQMCTNYINESRRKLPFDKTWETRTLKPWKYT